MKTVMSALVICGMFGCAATPTPTELNFIDSYDNCVRSGGQILRTSPPKCVTKDGFIFISPSTAACENQCGNGVCEELVCQAVGCPCSESDTSCPADCKR